jgi:PQQ-like domain
MLSQSATLPMLHGVILVTLASAQVPVLTYHNDNFRTGQNLQETKLTLSNVNVNSFGKLFTQPVDGQVYAQPLYMPNLTINGVTHNVVFVATENDSVYAFDADSNTGANAAPLWHAAFANPANGVTPVSSGDVGCTNISPQIGITGTPVIDASGGTLFVVTKTAQVSGGTTKYYQRLHALNVTSGAEKFGGPFVIQATVPGNCSPNSNGHVVFSPLRQNQRAGLTLTKDALYVTWASHCDNNPYTGWVMAFSPTTGKLLDVFNDDPDMGDLSYECRGGIWQGGAAPAVDAAGNLFLATGNGYFNANTTGGLDYGDTQLKLKFSSTGFAVGDYFTPYNQSSLDSGDVDLGSGGVLLLPDQSGPYQHLSVNAGKEGTIYLVNRDNMGKYNSSGDTQIVQSLPNAIGSEFGMPAYFNGMVYFGASYDSLKAFSLTSGLFASNPITQSTAVFYYPGPTVSISANGHTNAIVWAVEDDASGTGGPAVLYAYEATNLADALYDSNQNAARDQLGPAINFTVPTISNGKVYVGTGNSVSVFGLL